MRISDWSSDVCSSDLQMHFTAHAEGFSLLYRKVRPNVVILDLAMPGTDGIELLRFLSAERSRARILLMSGFDARIREAALLLGEAHARSEEHTSELQSLMRISYAVFCLKKKNNIY